MPKTCDRCNSGLRAGIVSKFNNDWLCPECKTDEQAAPGYAAADAAEVAAVRAGIRNFAGVGLSRADRDFLAVRLVERGLGT